jgi:CBS domain containing-hemolysin-like protein
LEEGPRKASGLRELIGSIISGRKRVTEEAIQQIIDAGEEEGLINEEENEMIRSIFEMKNRVVREIMVPRTDMATVSVDATLGEVLDTINGCGHSRIPVYEGTLDNITGLLYAKDLLREWGKEAADITLTRLLRAPFFIPETKNFEELLQDFKRKRVHIAIVIDEYGGTSGLVTIEDILEQIVGDIQDEYDTEEEWLDEQSDGAVVVDARLPVEELEERFSIEVERDKFDTVAGLIFHLIGRIPRVGEEVVTGQLLMTILDADARKIRKVRIMERQEPSETPAL